MTYEALISPHFERPEAALLLGSFEPFFHMPSPEGNSPHFLHRSVFDALQMKYLISPILIVDPAFRQIKIRGDTRGERIFRVVFRVDQVLATTQLSILPDSLHDCRWSPGVFLKQSRNCSSRRRALGSSRRRALGSSAQIPSVVIVDLHVVCVLLSDWIWRF